MNTLRVLKLKIVAPSAQFRVIHSNNPRKTYPLPPYSTVIGILANILGEQDKINHMLDSKFALGIVSQYQYLSREYTWMRNMSRNAHLGRFHSIENRKWQEIPEHPGGQSPITVEVLNEVELYIYLYHSDTEVLNHLKANMCAPEKWLSHIHLGRAEDWGGIENYKIMDLTTSNTGSSFRGATSYFQWMPEPDFAFGLDDHINQEEYLELYNKMQGNVVLVSSLYKLVEVTHKDGASWKIRNFQHVPARICSSQIPFLNNFTLPNLFTDNELNTPVYMALINSTNGEGGR